MLRSSNRYPGFLRLASKWAPPASSSQPPSTGCISAPRCERGLDLDQAAETGHYLALDAKATLEKFCVSMERSTGVDSTTP
jgi:hypothetical protein